MQGNMQGIWFLTPPLGLLLERSKSYYFVTEKFHEYLNMSFVSLKKINCAIVDTLDAIP